MCYEMTMKLDFMKCFERKNSVYPSLYDVEFLKDLLAAQPAFKYSKLTIETLE